MTRTAVAAVLAALIATGAPAQDEAAPEDAAPPEATDETPVEGTPEAEGTAETVGEGTPEAEGTAEPVGEGTPEPEATAEPVGEGAEATAEQALGLSMGQESAEVGQTYILEEHGDWDVRCVRTESGNDPCQLYQLLQDEEGNNVAEISVFPLPEGGQAVAGATIITPLETLLTAQVALQVDAGPVKRYPFSWCSSVGCFSRIGFTADEVVSFRRGAEATLTIRPVAAPDQTVDLGISLSGFTAGYESVAEANAAAQAEQAE